jgi:DNA-binding NarL/FixJ family response regulator
MRPPAAVPPTLRASTRQQQILDLLELGATDKEIAAELTVSYRTVRTHLEHLYRKFGVSTRTGMVTAWRRAKESDDVSAGSHESPVGPRT